MYIYIQEAPGVPSIAGNTPINLPWHCNENHGGENGWHDDHANALELSTSAECIGLPKGSRAVSLYTIHDIHTLHMCK